MAEFKRKPAETAYAPVQPPAGTVPEPPGWREVPLWDHEDQPAPFLTEEGRR